MRLRHAGVLGLCAFIASQPYDVSDYLPDIFAELGPHLNDPQPIPVSFPINTLLTNVYNKYNLNFTSIIII